MAKVFYAYTPHPNDEMKSWGITERATIAAKLEDGYLHYGIAICRPGDNFSRVEGKTWALKRLEAGFGKTKFNEYYQDISHYYAQEVDFRNDGTERAVIQFVNDLAKSVFLKLEKYKKKLASFK